MSEPRAQGRNSNGDTEPCGCPSGQCEALKGLPMGATGVVLTASACPKTAEELEALGLGPDTRFRVCRAGEPCIVAVSGRNGGTCRIGLSKHLTQGVLVVRDPELA